jgi:Acetyltransferase (GNAT) domain/Acetyltransferase (GNAT) family
VELSSTPFKISDRVISLYRVAQPELTDTTNAVTEGAYRVRTMERQEVNLAMEWAAAEGWNPGLHDARCFYAADPNGFLIGVLGDEPVATISVVKYGTSFGFVGFYIVAPAHRGLGYGIKIWNTGLALLQGRTVGLDGVVDQQDNYKKSGFVLAHRNVRYEGMRVGDTRATAAITPLSELSLDEITTYDQQFFPERRTQFLECWINQTQGAAFGFVQNGSLAGYGVLRPCRSGYKVGPLFADSPEIAESLFLALQQEIPNDAPIFLDTPAVNEAAVDLARRHNMTAVFETARMYANGNPDLPLDRIFGVTSFELG